MSKAGVESSRGDGYQTLVAASWAATMLIDPTLARLEVDATSLDETGLPYAVDDIVVSYTDGRQTCCQCKKNAPGFRAWTTATLADDLRKAWVQHRRMPRADILFYSASPFGKLAGLVERSRVMQDAAAFMCQLPRDLKAEYSALVALQDGNGEERADDGRMYAFLRRLDFRSVAHADLKRLSVGSLRPAVAHADRAFDSIRQLVDDLARRDSDSDRGAVPGGRVELTRERLLRHLDERGYVLAPLKSEEELADFFRAYSSRGRYWPRDIRGRHFVRRELTELTRLVGDGKRLVLVEGEPGAGKTCLLLDMLDALERRSEPGVIFLQTRDFGSADFDGLGDVFFGNLARLAERRPVVLLVDSLDVLSIAQERRVLSVFLGLLHRVSRLPNVTTVAACRSFDVRYDSRLSSVKWEATVTVGALDFEADVVPFLEEQGVNPADVADPQKILLGSPRMLSMYMDILGAGGRTGAVTQQELAEAYVRTLIVDDPALGDEACAELCRMARVMVDLRCLSLSESRAKLSTDLARRLLSAGVLVRTERGYAFSHQTLVDILAVMAADVDQLGLADFIRALKPVPFVRPSVRAFFFHLRAHAPERFVRETRAALAADDLAFHLKRLLAASLADIVPTDDDWLLLKYLFQRHPDLFSVFFEAADADRWEPLFHKRLLPWWRETDNGPWLFRHAVKASGWGGLTSGAFVDMWLEVLDREDVGTNAAWPLIRALEKWTFWMEPRLDEIFRRLMQKADINTLEFLGNPLSRWVAATDAHDDLLWEYVAYQVDTTERVWDESQKFFCRSHDFYKKTFFAERMEASETLLSLAVSFIEDWSRTQNEVQGVVFPGGHFLKHTSHHKNRSQGNIIYRGEGIEILLDCLEQACSRHGRDDTDWWRTHRDSLLHSQERALQYLGILGCQARPESNIAAIESLLLAVRETHGYPFEYELGCLLQAVAFELKDTRLSEIENILLHLYEEEGKADSLVLRTRRDWLQAIPAPLRSRTAQALIDKVNKAAGPSTRKPPVLFRGGPVHAPFSFEVFLNASDAGVVRLLSHYAEYRDWENRVDDLVGGTNEVSWELRRAASLDPDRFSAFLKLHGRDIPALFRGAILGGLGHHMDQRRPSSSEKDWFPRSLPDTTVWLDAVLNLLECSERGDKKIFGWLEALQICAREVRTLTDVERVCFLLMSCTTLASDIDVKEDDDLLSHGLNCLQGKAAEAAMRLTASCLENSLMDLPEMLTTLLVRFAKDRDPAVRAVVLNQLPYILYKKPDIGWVLLEACVSSGPKALWNHAYECLYHSYTREFERVDGYLQRMKAEAMPEAGKTWGLLATLAFLSGHLAWKQVREALREMDVEEAWKGAMDVLITNIHNAKYYALCAQGIDSILSERKLDIKIGGMLNRLFWDKDGRFTSFPLDFIRKCFVYKNTHPQDRTDFFHPLGKWLLWISNHDAELGITVTEWMVHYAQDHKRWILVEREIPHLLTRFFREAEDNEEVDGGALLKRVVALQDEFLVLGTDRIEEWLEAAERP